MRRPEDARELAARLLDAEADRHQARECDTNTQRAIRAGVVRRLRAIARDLREDASR